MTNPVDVQIAAMVAHLGLRYELGPTRCTGADGYHDCSGLAVYGLNAARKTLGLPEIPCWQADTFQFEALGRKQGLMTSLDYGRATRGMWVGWNDGNHGHMGTSLGDGRTIEARSHALDLGIFQFDNRGWEWAMKPPGLTGLGDPSDPTVGGFRMANAPVAHPTKQGYWCVDDDGHVFAYGASKYHGGQGTYWKDGEVVSDRTAGAVKIVLNGKCVGLTPTPSGNGYWLLTDVGSIYTFGDAAYFGDPHP